MFIYAACRIQHETCSKRQQRQRNYLCNLHNANESRLSNCKNEAKITVVVVVVFVILWSLLRSIA